MELLNHIVQNDDRFIPLVLATVAIVWILWKGVSSMVVSTARERTKREIAAYIAEGSMSPEQGERLMASGGRRSKCDWGA